MVRRLNAYVGKERIHCFSVVRPVAMTKNAVVTVVRGNRDEKKNSSLIVIMRTQRVILDFQWGSEGFERV